MRKAHARAPGWRRALIVLTVVTVGLPVAAPANAAPANAKTVPQQATKEGSQRVTLITGDRVAFTDKGEFTVEPAARPDGSEVTFSGRTGDGIRSKEDFYVIPSDAQQRIAAGKLDRNLFNVKELVRNGITDRSEKIPVIVKGDAKGARAATATRTLSTIGGAALKVDRGNAAQFWSSARDAEKIWLDRKVRASLDHSVPQIGAPEAWKQGYDGKGITVAVVDTGVDKSHPDLADRVTAEKNFTEEEDAVDRHGHGTHVASTVAGSGAASGGKYKGVAPGAKIINARVLDSGGSGEESQVVAGLEWAARSGAKVVNVSLGAGPTDGQDPMSLAVNKLTAETGALFVIAAGNSGYAGSINSPGTADAALTVGAVDRSNKLADFSSRGPRWGDGAVKPEITAPGVGIVAARAADTGMGTPVDERYTGASGTSMATPHVAGAAAITAQARPGLKAGQLKDLLVTSARPYEGTQFEQGAGRVDLPRALAATVSGPAAVNAGRLTHNTGPAYKPVTYTNTGSSTVVLRLSFAGKAWNGKPLPAGAAGVVPSVLVVRPGSTATAYTLVSSHVGVGSYGGVITARTDTSETRTPVSWYVADKRHDLHVRTLGHDGSARPGSSFRGAVIRDDIDAATNNDPFVEWYFDVEAKDDEVVAKVPPGTYTALNSISSVTFTGRQSTQLIAVDQPVRRETTITLDARTTVPITVRTPTPMDQRFSNVWLSRYTGYFGYTTIIPGFTSGEVRVSPTPPAKRGYISLQEVWTFADRILTAKVDGKELATRHDPHGVSRMLAGNREAPIVWAGTGENFAGVDVRGKVALIGLKPPNTIYDAVTLANAAAGRAAAAGAVAVLSYVDLAGAAALPTVSSEAVGHLTVSQADGAALRAKPGTLTTSAKSNPAHLYNLHFGKANGIDARLDHVVNPAALRPVDTRYHASVDGLKLWRAWYGGVPSVGYSGLMPAVHLQGPVALTEYVGGASNVEWTRIGVVNDANRNGITMYNRLPITAKEDFFQGPMIPTAQEPLRAFFRVRIGTDEDLFRATSLLSDGSPGHVVDTDAGGYRATTWKLTRDGIDVKPIGTPFSNTPYFPMPNAAAAYELTATTVLPATGFYGPSKAVWSLSPRVDTTWNFRSARSAGEDCGEPFICADQPAVQLNYDLALNLRDRAPAGQHAITVRPVVPAGAVGGGTIAGATVSYSTDEGVTWQSAPVTSAGPGVFRATVTNPGSGYVWLRTEAWDSAGNRVKQTVQRAYGIG